jgi:hypothetical protein
MHKLWSDWQISDSTNAAEAIIARTVILSIMAYWTRLTGAPMNGTWLETGYARTRLP